MALNINSLTLGEIDKIETLAGQPITAFGEDNTPQGKMMAAIAFVMKRRQQMAEGVPPSFTWNEALDLTMDETKAILGITGDDEDQDTAQDAQDAPQEAPNRATRRKGTKGTAKARREAVTDDVAVEPDPTPGE